MTPQTPCPKTSCRLIAHWIAGAALCLAASALIAEAPPAETANEAPETAAEAPAAGLRAYLDPETGELTSTPSAEQVEALSRRLEKSLNWSDEGLEAFELSLGGSGVFLDGRFQSALVVRRAPDGGFELSCVDDPEHALPHDHADAAPPASEWAVR